jgi:hypothetical protein
MICPNFNLIGWKKYYALAVSVLLTTCGSPKITKSPNQSVNTESAKDAAVFWLDLDDDGCSQEAPNYKRTEYNKNGSIINEKTCTYNPATKIRVVTSKLINNPQELKLEDRHYEETEYNSLNRPTKKTVWTLPDKKSVFSQTIIVYRSSGTLESAIETTEKSVFELKTVTKYSFDEKEDLISRKTERYDKNQIVITEENTCYPSHQIYQARACSITTGQQVTGKVEKEGEDTIWKQLINDTLTEILRQSQFSDFGWAKVARKQYDEATGKILYLKVRAQTRSIQ